MKDTLTVRVRFGAFELDLKSGELWEGGRKVVLPEQPFQVLRILVEKRRRSRKPGRNPEETLAQ